MRGPAISAGRGAAVRGNRPYFFIFLYRVTRLTPSSWAARVRLNPAFSSARRMAARSVVSRLCSSVPGAPPEHAAGPIQLPEVPR